MPGSWEYKREPAVLCAILHTDATTIAWAFGLRNLVIPGPWPPMPLAGMPYDHARNMACMRALECGADYIFFLDSDVIPPHDAIIKLLAHNKPLISGLYCRRSPPVGLPVMIRKGSWVTDYIRGSIVEVDMVGAGCLLIRRDVLEKCPPCRPGHQWFDWTVDMKGILPITLSEDFMFCVHVRQTLGIPTLVDTSIRCRHAGFGESEEGSFKPLEAIPAT